MLAFSIPYLRLPVISLTTFFFYCTLLWKHLHMRLLLFPAFSHQYMIPIKISFLCQNIIFCINDAKAMLLWKKKFSYIHMYKECRGMLFLMVSRRIDSSSCFFTNGYAYRENHPWLQERSDWAKSLFYCTIAGCFTISIFFIKWSSIGNQQLLQKKREKYQN